MLFSLMAHYFKLAGRIEKGLSIFSEIPTWNSSSNPTHVPTRNLHYRQIFGFCNFEQIYCIKSCLRVTECGLNLALCES